MGQPPQPPHHGHPGQPPFSGDPGQFRPQPQPQFQPQPQPQFQPGGHSIPPPPPARRPRTALTITVAAAVTLIVAGTLTWTGIYAFSAGGASGIQPARGLPPDPCSALGEETLDDLDGELSSWSEGIYSNGCAWGVSLADQDVVHLYLNRSVPMSEADADLVEEIWDDGAARNTDELYELALDDAAELGYDSDTAEIVDTEERDLDFGDESALVLTDIDYTGSGIYFSQRVTVVVREGDLVSQISLTLTSSADDMDAAEAEEMLAEVATDAFG